MGDVQQRQPPPTTMPRKVTARQRKDAQVDIEIQAEVIADGTSTDSTVKGHTSFDPKGALPDGQGGTSFYRTPGYSWEKRGGLEVVTKLGGLVEIKGTVRIQTVYGPNAGPAMTSGYGRGTTPEDEKAGNTSLGFHESCHREDHLNYLRTQPLPTFGGRAGLTRKDYDRAATAFAAAMTKYFSDMEQDSHRRTDEVGYKKSDYDRNGPRP